MRVAVTGASGLIGQALKPELETHGHQVVTLVRRRPAAGEREWDGRSLAPDALADIDAVVHLAGAGVGDKRWTAAYKRTVLTSRVEGTTAVALAVAAAGTPVLLSSSAIGIYGDTGDRVTDESGPRGNGFLAEVCEAWEAATTPADVSARVVHLRTGVVLSTDGGALRKQLPIFKAGLGAPLGSGRQWLSWITIRDEVAAIRHLLTADVSGPVNLVAPAPVTNSEFTKALGKALHRPTLPVPVPGFVLRASLGGFADEAVLHGQRLLPAVLQGSGFAFQDSALASALEGLFAHE
ncbi:MAG: hypothetical protein JWM40_1496 [Frankiales bacterium]|nr:hypothetical protein [Frankiales bacterium]